MSEPTIASTEATCPPHSRAAARQAWAERLARFPNSGLSPAQFYAREGVSLATFYAWKRRLASADSSSDAGSGPRLLSVCLATPDTAVELVLPCGAVVRLLPGSDLAFVRALVQALGEQSC